MKTCKSHVYASLHSKNVCVRYKVAAALQFVACRDARPYLLHPGNASMDQIAWAPSHGLAGEAHFALVYQLRFSPKLLLLRTHEARAVVDLPAHSQETWFLIEPAICSANQQIVQQLFSC